MHTSSTVLITLVERERDTGERKGKEEKVVNLECLWNPLRPYSMCLLKMNTIVGKVLARIVHFLESQNLFQSFLQSVVLLTTETSKPQW